MQLFTIILYQPLFNLLVFLYNIVPGHDLGIAIILLTVLVRLILYPLNRKAIVSQKNLQTLQPKLNELKEKYKDNREALSKEMMELYRREKINPFSSCLPILIQLPILLAVFSVFRNGLNGTSFQLLYPFVMNPVTLHTVAFGFLDLTKRSIVLGVLTGIAQFWQTKMLMGARKKAVGNDMASAMNTQMLYVMPVFTGFLGATFPSGLALYWFFTTLFSGLQQVWMIRRGQIAKA